MTDPHLAAAALRSMAPRPSGRTGSLVLLVCDEQGRPLRTVVLSRPPACPNAAGPVLERAFSQLQGMSLVFGHARPGPAAVSLLDHRWRRAAERAALGRVRLLGSYLISRSGVRSIPGSTGNHPAAQTARCSAR